MAVWGECTSGVLPDNAVDMMDNVRASPTCPQRQHQQQPFAMVDDRAEVRHGAGRDSN
jgi:hypothetical protein